MNYDSLADRVIHRLQHITPTHWSDLCQQEVYDLFEQLNSDISASLKSCNTNSTKLECDCAIASLVQAFDTASVQLTEIKSIVESQMSAKGSHE